MLYIVPTIDTENPQSLLRCGKIKKNMIDPMIFGKPWGVSCLAKVFSSYAIQAVFFVATNEKYHFGEDTYRKVIQQLSSDGHEIALHTHPEWQDSLHRVNMWQFSGSEQTEILREMMCDIKDWSGRVSVSHRAGAYGLNSESVKALNDVGIKIDSSMFHGHPNCKLSWSKNRIVERGGIIEVPVTGYYRIDCLKFGLIRFPFRKVFVKTDLNSCSLEELFWFVDEAKKKNIKVMNLFMHSYSLMKLDQLPSLVEDGTTLSKLKTFLESTKENPNICYITLRELERLYRKNPEEFIVDDVAPTRMREISSMKFFELLKKKLMKQSRQLFEIIA